MQLLFNLTRESDPVTSQVAASEIEPKLEGRRAEFVEALKNIGIPSTANEIAARCEASVRESVRKRAKECVRLGFVAKVGSKTCGVTGKLATVYWVV